MIYNSMIIFITILVLYYLELRDESLWHVMKIIDVPARQNPGAS